ERDVAEIRVPLIGGAHVGIALARPLEQDVGERAPSDREDALVLARERRAGEEARRDDQIGILEPPEIRAEQGHFLELLRRRPKAPAVRDGGVLIIPAQLEDGEGDDPVEITSLVENCLVVIAASESPEIVRIANLRAAVDVEEALDIAYEHIGRPQRASVLLVPRAQQRST